MGLINRVVKAIKPVMGGNVLFESFGVPPEQSTLDDLKRYNKTVHTVVSAITDEVGNLNVQLFKNDKEITSHWLLDLIDNPNPVMRLTTYNLWEFTQTYMELAGEAFWYLASGANTGVPKLVFILRPDKMSVVPMSDGSVKGYVLRKDDGTNIPFEPKEILHFKTPNPLNLYRGYGTTRASRDFIQTDDFASKWVRNSFYNNARPSALISLKGNINQQEFEKIEKKWQRKYGGVANASKVALIRSADIDYQELSLGLDKVAIKEIKEMTREDVMFMFRVSKPMLGILTDVNLASAKTANRAFMQRVIKPKMQRLCDTLEQYIYDEGIKVKFDNPVEEDKTELADYHQKELNVGLTINEIREELGKDPIEGGEYIYQPINLMPLGKPVAKVKGQIKTTRTRRIKKVEAVEAKDTAEIKDNVAEIKLIHWKTMNGIKEAWLKRYLYTMDKVLEAEQKAVLAKLKGKAKDITEVLPVLSKAEEQWLISIMPIALGLFTDEANYAAEIIGTTTPNIGKSVEQQLSERLTKVFGEFDQRRVDELAKSLAEGYTNGDTLKQLSDRVTQHYENYKGYQSERLARTETKRIANEGALETYDQSQVVTGKEWFANPGACEFCEAMNGTHIDLENNFKEVGEMVTGTAGGSMAITYDNVDTADLHPNCECLLLPWSEEFEETGKFSKTDSEVESDS